MIRYAAYPLILLALAISIISYFESFTFLEAASQLLLWVLIADILLFHLRDARALEQVRTGRDVEVGERIAVRLTFVADAPLHLSFEDRNSLPCSEGSMGEITLAPSTPALHGYELGRTPGMCSIGPVRVWASDPMLLCFHQATVGEVSRVKITPQLPQAIRTSLQTSRRGRSSTFMSTDFHSVREYVEGDDASRIAWALSGRRDGRDIYVRMMEPEGEGEIAVLLDYSMQTQAGCPESMYASCIRALLRAAMHPSNVQDTVLYHLYSDAVKGATGPRKGREAAIALSKMVSETFPSGKFDLREGLHFVLSQRVRPRPLLIISPLLGSMTVPDASLYPSRTIIISPSIQSFAREGWKSYVQSGLLGRGIAFQAIEAGYTVLEAVPETLNDAIMHAWRDLKS